MLDVIYNFIIQNKEILKIPYGFIICLICAIIFFKTDRLFRVSAHQGIRYFRNAFFFFSLAFLIRYIMGSNILVPFIHENYFFIIKLMLEFFFVMAGFFLLYSLVWKNIGERKHFVSSLFNPVISLFYLMSLLIIAIDYIWNTYFLMFVSQIVIFIIASAISFNNYLKNKKGFPKFYFLAMILTLTAWILNSIAALFEWNQIIIINVSAINILIFLLFLWGVVKFSRRV